MPPTRRQELARLLDERGFSRRWRSCPPVDPGATLAQVLGELGPGTAAFARYLARSPERLPTMDRSPLAAVPQNLSTLSPEAVQRVIERQLGAPLEHHFADFEKAPATVTLHHQIHRARRVNGSPVQVRVLRSEAPAEVTAAVEALGALEELVVEGWQLEGAVTEFQEECAVRRHLSGAARAASTLHRLAECTQDLESERPLAARVVPDLSTEEIMTVAMPEGVDATDNDEEENRFRLYRSWLLLAVVDGLLWIGPWSGNVRFVEGPPLFLGGHAFPLDRDQRWDLRDYLAATRRGEADLALGYLLRAGTRAPHALPVERLRDHFRQAVSPVTDTGRSLASLLFVHTHLLGTHGYRPAPALLAWQRSLAELELLLESTMPDVPPDADPLADAVDDARILGAAARGREIFAPAALRQTFLQHGPRWFETLERRAAGIDDESTPSSASPSTPPRGSGTGADAWVGFGVPAILLGLVALLGEGLRDLHPAFAPAMAVLFSALALYTLWFVFRSSPW